MTGALPLPRRHSSHVRRGSHLSGMFRRPQVIHDFMGARGPTHHKNNAGNRGTIASVGSVGPMMQKRRLIKRAFSSIDEDNSKHIDFEEFLKACGERADPADVRTLFGLLDEDGSGTIERRELVHALKKNEAAHEMALKMEGLRAMFERSSRKSGGGKKKKKKKSGRRSSAQSNTSTKRKKSKESSAQKAKPRRKASVPISRVPAQPAGHMPRRHSSHVRRSNDILFADDELD